jgi:hypothetical protein
MENKLMIYPKKILKIFSIKLSIIRAKDMRLTS